MTRTSERGSLRFGFAQPFDLLAAIGGTEALSMPLSVAAHLFLIVKFSRVLARTHGVDGYGGLWAVIAIPSAITFVGFEFVRRVVVAIVSAIETTGQ